MRSRYAPAATLAGTLVLGTAFAQGPNRQATPATSGGGGGWQSPTVPDAWDVIVTVRKDGVGADLVSFGARRSDYPPDLLRAQIWRLGERLGSGARGVSVSREALRVGDRSSAVVRGSCGVDGLIEASGGLNVAPLAQAFAGAPEPHTIRRMLVSFDGVPIVPGKTMAYHTAGPRSDLVFSGRPVGSSVEYDVELRSQDPARLVVNEAQAAQTKAPASPKASNRLDPLTVGLFSLAALAAGSLVYCLLILVGRRPVAKS